ncbi:MAG TPA: YhjD/YihY/BrkB family envelope integrity protein, partial [Myxococcota bacterium]|nr:YhjD/YihY/BrkB family envelope integrity protein [Myxococcota bacterium]
MRLARLWDMVKATFSKWNDDKASSLAAALAFYTMLSLGPLLVVVIAVAGLVFGRDAVQHEVMGQVRDLVGPMAAETVQSMIEHASTPQNGWMATLLGIGTLLFGATGVFAALQDAMDTVWNVAPRPDAGLELVLKQRLLSFAMVLGIGFLLVVSLVASAAVAAVAHVMSQLVPSIGWIGELANALLSMSMVTILFAA